MKNCEKRELKKRPDFQLSKIFFNEFEDYYKDNFTFRNLINHLNSSIKYFFFGSSSRPQKALVGNNDWFYYTSKKDMEMESFSHKNLLSKEELDKKMKNWEKRKNNLNKNGIEYYTVVWPNKSTICHENLPFRMRIQQSDSISKLDQIIDHLKNNGSSIKIIDVRKFLSEKNRSANIYHKHDTHWNSLGAFYAYQKLMNSIHFSPYNIDEFDLNWTETSKGDLINIMGLCNSNSIIEEEPTLKIKNKNHNSETLKTDFENMSLIKNVYAESNKKILIFRDSYTSAVIKYISLHFKESYFVWSYYDEEIVNNVKPDIVLVVNVERFFCPIEKK